MQDEPLGVTLRSLMLTLTTGTLLLAGCGAASTERPSETKPAQNISSIWMKVFENQNDWFKACDGTTLLYIKYGAREQSIEALPNSPECTSK